MAKPQHQNRKWKANRPQKQQGPFLSRPQGGEPYRERAGSVIAVLQNVSDGKNRRGKAEVTRTKERKKNTAAKRGLLPGAAARSLQKAGQEASLGKSKAPQSN